MNEFWSGVRRGLPVLVSVAPFGILYGAIAADHGLSIAELTLMSATVFAGASQLVGIDLFGHNIQPWVIILSIFAVNFRHVLYSAALARHVDVLRPWQRAVNFFFMTDPHYAEIERRSLSGEPLTFAWVMGLGLCLYLPWVALSTAGGVLGAFIGDPKAIGLDVLLPVYFLGLVMGFRTRANWLPVVAASAVGSMVGIKLIGSPWHVMAGAAAGILMAVVLPLPENTVEPRQVEGEGQR